MNETIDKIITLLQKLKVKNEIKNVTLSSGMVSITATIRNGRISLSSRSGQTELSFSNRKASTIKALADCIFFSALSSICAKSAKFESLSIVFVLFYICLKIGPI